MITDQAFILHKRLYKDSSELIKLITMNHGIIDAIAKGSQRPKSKLNGQLQPFTLTQVNLIGKSGLKTLVGAEQSAVLKQCSYINHVSMLYCNELLVLLNPDEDTVKTIFAGYTETIELLSSNQNVHLPLRRFEWLMCCSQGYQLSLPAGYKPADFVSFCPVNGLEIIQHNNKCTAQSFESFIQGASINAVQMREIKHLMRTVIDHMVHGKTIQSRALLINQSPVKK